MKKIIYLKLLLIVLFLGILLTVPAFSQDWQDRLQQHEKDFNKMKKEHTLMYRMIAELYIKRMGYKKYENLVSGGENGHIKTK